LDQAHLKQGEFDEAIASLNELWTQTYPESSFDYYFLNEKFRAQDQQEQYFGSLFQAFTILSMILSCLGLFGLSILISAKRQKEIGVRKTFGATSLDILNLFMRGYLGPLATALIIGSAGSYFLMREWLTNFANRIEIGPSLMLSAAATLIAIFLGTISYHTLKAALTNPVSVLRD
jgi:putative ABC transport system permease protein